MNKNDKNLHYLLQTLIIHFFIHLSSQNIMEKEELLEKNFGALFVGPPGAGKSTCVKTLKEICERLKRHCITINLDPANDHLDFEPNFDVCSLMNVKEVMNENKLGPNGALMFCMESVAESVHEITEAIKPLVTGGCYILIDCPGQVELYTHSDCMRNFIHDFCKDLNARMAVVNLVDINIASTKEGFLGQSLMSLGTMLRLYTPHINILSKYDLIESVELNFDPTNFDFDEFMVSEDKVPNQLHQAIVEILNGFDLVSYLPFTVNDETAVIELLNTIDKAVGCSWML